MARLILIAALTCVPQVAYSQSEKCSDALISDKVMWSYDIRVKLAILQLIDNSNFETKKREFSSGMKLPVDGIPIDTFTNFSDFREARRKEFSRYSFDLDSEEAANFASESVPPAAFKAYVECLKYKASSQHGVHLFPELVTPNYIEVDLVWNSPPPVAEGQLSIQLSGGEFTSQPPALMAPQTVAPLTIKRNSGEDLRLTVAANGLKPARINFPFVKPVAEIKPEPSSVSGYRAKMSGLGHVQDVGDVNSSGEEWLGVRGRHLRLEGFELNFIDTIPGLSVEYMCHRQSYGDTQFIAAGEFCGTRSSGLRLEGWAARLTGPNADQFSLQYWCHLQSLGDRGPFTNGQFCGTRGERRRMEAIRWEIVRK